MNPAAYGPGGPWGPPPGGGWAEEAEPELNIMEYVRLVWARKWIVLGIAAAAIVLAAAWALTQPKMYRAEAKITLYPAPQLTENQLDMMMSWWQMDRFIADQIEILKTRSLAERVVARLGLDSHPEFAGGDAAGALLGRIDAEPVRDSFVVKVSMVGYDPGTTSEWLNVYIEEYQAANIDAGIERIQEVFKVIQQRLDPLRDQVQKAEQALVDFREGDTELLFADQDKNVISEQISKLTTDYADAKAERIRLETRLNALRNLKASELAQTGFPEVLQDPTIQGLLQQRADLAVELSDKLRDMKEGHPQIQELRSSLASVNSRIYEQIQIIKTALETDFSIARQREQSLFDNIQQLKGQSIDLTKQTLKYQRLEEEYQQSRTFLDNMLARSKEADLSKSTPVSNVRVIEDARPPGGPFKPNLRRSVALGGVLGLFLGVGLVLFLDFLDHTLRTPDQIERYIGLETLAALPKFTEDTARVLRESFQSLRTALMLAGRGDKCHIVQVTSAMPEEGKTTVAYNLAKVLATAGSRTLLIDADLRKPRIHRLINAKNVRGLTSVVLGERELPEVTHTVPEVPTLDIVTSGPLPPNPPELFGKHTFLRLLATARESYDWVVLDTPPVISVTDPVMASRTVDMVLLVIQYGGARRQLIREAVRLLSRTGVRIAGAVFNKVDIERDHYYYSGYYSYYHYGDDGARVKKKKAKAKAS
jgi:succinoglycan biosynthesis transport protein ExoP